MRLFIFTLFMLFCSSFISAESPQEKSALEHVMKYIESENSGDYKTYTDYLLPSYYSNNSEFKEDFMKLWKKLFAEKRDPVRYESMMKIGKFGNDWQVMFYVTCRNQDWVIYGISSDDAKSWHFSQLYSKPGNFTGVLRDIPTFDNSFAALLDPHYGKRIDYIIGQKITPFNYTDINGVVLNSDDLKGKVIVLNFWSPSCGPCRAEMPELNKLVDRMSGKDVVFIAPVIYATKEQLLMPAYISKYPFKYHQVVIDSNDYNVLSFPTHIVIGKDRRIIDIMIGNDYTNITRIEQMIIDELK